MFRYTQQAYVGHVDLNLSQYHLFFMGGNKKSKFDGGIVAWVDGLGIVSYKGSKIECIQDGRIARKSSVQCPLIVPLGMKYREKCVLSPHY